MRATKKVQVYLPPSEFERLRKLAFQRHTSLSSLLRDVVIQRFPKKKSTSKKWAKVVGLFSDSAPDVSEKHDDYLSGLK